MCHFRSVFPLFRSTSFLRITQTKVSFSKAFVRQSYGFYKVQPLSTGFSIWTIACFCIGMRQFLLLPNSTMTVSSVMSMITP